jgi:CheY-like chemotaxis protein
MRKRTLNMAKEKILVVDDEKDFVDLISGWLEMKKFRVMKAYDGKEGFEKIRSERPDLMLLDITMPEMNGYDLCVKLKTDKDYKDIPIIILSAHFQPNDIEFGKAVGAAAYMTKPVELEQLMHKMEELLGSKSSKL